jgi:hypothetical protein
MKGQQAPPLVFALNVTKHLEPGGVFPIASGCQTSFTGTNGNDFTATATITANTATASVTLLTSGTAPGSFYASSDGGLDIYALAQPGTPVQITGTRTGSTSVATTMGATGIAYVTGGLAETDLTGSGSNNATAPITSTTNTSASQSSCNGQTYNYVTTVPLSTFVAINNCPGGPGQTCGLSKAIDTISISILIGCQTKVTRLSQAGWAAYDPYDHSTTTIQARGCALTSLSMALRTANIATLADGLTNNPGTLNQFMSTNDTDYYGTAVNWGPATRDASGGHVKFHFGIFDSTDNAQAATQYLDDTVCRLNKPVIVGVELDSGGTPSHFVVVTGKQGSDYTIADPGFARTTLTAYDNEFVTRGFVADPSGDISELNFAVGDVAEFLIVNSSGQKTGYDPSIGQVVQQITNSVYFRDALQDDLTGAPPIETDHFSEIFQPSQGTYQIVITGLKLGTYSVSSRMFSQDGSPQPELLVPGIAGPGSSSAFSIQVNSTPGAISTVAAVATFESTVGDISNALALGLIDNQGNANSLSQKILAARDANQPSRGNILNAFINEVNAQNGKHISAIAAHVLSQDASSLLSQ